MLKSFVFAALAVLSLFANAQVPQPPEIAARSYVLVDITANQVLAVKDADVPVEPASLTKLMTAYLVFDALRSKKIDLKQTLPVSDRAWKMPGSRMFIDPTMQVPVEDLIKGMLVQAGNDATMALAEGVGGTAEHFVRMMNAQAKVLGMKSTAFKNPDGMTDVGHFTTARDLSVLAVSLLTEFPEYAGYFAVKKYRYPGTPAANDSNRNLLLLRDPSVDGMAVGYTEISGYGMVATAKRHVPVLTAVGGERRLLAVVLGAANENTRANESQKLLNWGFAAFEPIKLFDAGQAVVESKVWKGVSSQVRMGRPQGVVVVVPTGSGGAMKTQVIRKESLVAPIAKGQVIGSLRIVSNDQTVAEIPLLALEGVEQSGVLGRAWDALRLWVQ